MTSHVCTKSIAALLVTCWLAVPVATGQRINWESLDAAAREDDSSRRKKYLPTIKDPQVKAVNYIELQTRPRTTVAAKPEARSKAVPITGTWVKLSPQDNWKPQAQGRPGRESNRTRSGGRSPALSTRQTTASPDAGKAAANPSLVTQVAHWRESLSPGNPMSPAAQEVHVGDNLVMIPTDQVSTDTSGCSNAWSDNGSGSSESCSDESCSDGSCSDGSCSTGSCSTGCSGWAGSASGGSGCSAENGWNADCCGDCGCGSSWSFSADYLYWKVRRRGLDVAIEDTNPGFDSDGPIKSIGLNWDSGARASLRYTSPRGWDLTSTYTFFETDNRGLFTAPAGGALFATRTPNTAPSIFDTAAATVFLDYDVVDVEMGRWISLTYDFSYRPFFGVRGGEIIQELGIAYQGDFPVASTVVGITEQTRIDFYGLRCGGEFHWHVRDCVSVFGRGAASVMVGDYSALHAASQTPLAEPPLSDFLVTNEYTQLLPVLETALGVEWRRGPLTFQAGYDAAIWFNAMEQVTFDSNVPALNFSQLTNVSNNLGLDGLFARVTFTR